MAQSYVNDTSSTASAPEDLLRSPLQVGGPRLRAFTGGVVTSVGVTVLVGHRERDLLFVVTAAICITIAVLPVRPTPKWCSPFLSGLGLGLLMSGTFLWYRPHATGATGEWMIAVAVGSLLFWLLPGRHQRPVFLLSVLVATMIGVAVGSTDATIDATDHVVWRFLDSFEPSVVTLIFFAIAYTLGGMMLDQWEMSGGAGTFFVAAIVGAGWALIIAFGSSERAVLAAMALTGVLLFTAGSIGGRRIVLHVGLLIFGVSFVRFLDAPELTNNVQRPDVPNTVYIGVVLILFGLLMGRGVHGD